MPAKLACIAGEDLTPHWKAHGLAAECLGPKPTPFGDSGCVYRLGDDDGATFYLLARSGSGMDAAPPHAHNARANLYALKDLGVQAVLGWADGTAVTRSFALGDLVILSDVIDQTCRREASFFDDSPLGGLRQFPVFCPTLRRYLAEQLDEMKLLYHASAVAAVCEGPRQETPAEVRMLSTFGADMITHSLLPEPFLARELQMAYVAVCRIDQFAETGSRYKPFATGELFGGLDGNSAHEPHAPIVALGQLAARVAGRLARQDFESDFLSAQQGHIEAYNLPADWHDWFEHR